MENIVFDLGGVLFARDRSKCTQEFHDFFSFIRSEPMPAFWEITTRGVLTLDEVTGILSGVNACPRAKCEEYLRLSIDMQEPVKPTEQLVRDLKAAGYKLFVLSNMSREFIDFLRRFPGLRAFRRRGGLLRGGRGETRAGNLPATARPLRTRSCADALYR